jgi:hypothetical protein
MKVCTGGRDRPQLNPSRVRNSIKLQSTVYYREKYETAPGVLAASIYLQANSSGNHGQSPRQLSIAPCFDSRVSPSCPPSQIEAAGFCRTATLLFAVVPGE